MAATTPQGRLQGKNAIITGAGGYVYNMKPEKLQHGRKSPN